VRRSIASRLAALYATLLGITVLLVIAASSVALVYELAGFSRDIVFAKHEEARVLAEQLAEANRQLQNAQDEIFRSKTMIAVGEMAAGAAHEMNNPLAVISGRSQLLAAQLEDAKQ
jgi:signal transduction histidine kinase